MEGSIDGNVACKEGETLLHEISNTSRRTCNIEGIRMQRPIRIPLTEIVGIYAKFPSKIGRRQHRIVGHAITQAFRYPFAKQYVIYVFVLIKFIFYKQFILALKNFILQALLC